MQVGIACYAQKLRLVSDAIDLLGQAGKKLIETEDEKLRDLASKVEELRLEVLKAVRDVLPPEGDA